MLAKRLPLLLVFAGGCLSGAVLIGALRGAPESAASPPRSGAFERRAALAPVAESSERDHERVAATEIVGAKKSVAVVEGEPQEESGSSLSEVLGRLEATYREGLAAAREPEVVPPPAALREPEAAPTAEPAPVATVAPAAVVPASAPVTVAVAAPAAAPAVVAVPAAAAPAPEAALAARVPAPPAVHVGDVNHVNIGSVHVGDVVQLQQQLALLQYMQLFRVMPGAALPPPGRVGPPAREERRSSSRPAPFSTKLTDPNNPWGFDFPPTVLAK